MTAARRSWGAAVAAALGLAVPCPSAAAMRERVDAPATDESARERAKLLVERGARAYEQGEYERALAAFQDAAAIYASPDFHFNIGLCQERLGEHAAAARSFEAYLRNKPDAPDRATVDLRIELLRELAAKGEPSEPTTEGEVDDDAIDASQMPRSQPPSLLASVPASAPRTDVAPSTKQRSGRGATGAGATLLVAGAGLAVGGGVAFDVPARRRAEAVEDVVEHGNPDALTYGETRELARESDRYRGLQIGAIAVGVAMFAVGVGLLAMGRRRARAGAGRVHAMAPALGTVRIAW